MLAEEVAVGLLRHRFQLVFLWVLREEGFNDLLLSHHLHNRILANQVGRLLTMWRAPIFAAGKRNYNAQNQSKKCFDFHGGKSTINLADGKRMNAKKQKRFLMINLYAISG